MRDKLVVYADEAFWAGDKKAEGVLKAMITEDTIQIEMKGKDVVACLTSAPLGHIEVFS